MNPIELDTVSKVYRGKTVLNGLTLRVPPGAVCALLGDNGSGKSTTMKILTGQVPADRGTVRVLGQDAWRQAIALRQRVGYVPEKPRFHDWMTVNELGWFVGSFHTPQYADRFRTALERLGVAPTATLRELSKGGYAKVALAVALAAEPEVLLLDEPTSGLDLHVRRDFLAGMVDMAAEGKTVLLTTHQIGEAERVASHVAFLRAGQVFWFGPLDTLKERLCRVRVVGAERPPDIVGSGQIVQQRRDGNCVEATLLDRVPARLAQLREQASSYHEVTPTLEEAYLAICQP
jgi:ABC-2 type transport system ATP-binding protein